MNIEKYIPELLFEHDCVIVPGFGGFIGNDVPARINPVHHTFYPPSKSILFNTSLKQNDGLLANHIAREENISFLDSLRAITRTTVRWNQLLKDDRPVEIPMVGVIRKDGEGNLQFEQERSINFFPEAFGLSSFVSPAIQREKTHTEVKKKIPRYTRATEEHHRIIPKALKWAAILSLPIGIAVILSLTNKDKVRNLTMNYSSLIYSVTSENTPGSATKPAAVIPREKILLPVTISLMKPWHPAPAFSTALQDHPYAIIVGAFRLKTNADRLVEKLRKKGFDSSILDITASGLYRVTLQTYGARGDALAQLSVSRNREFPTAWLLKKDN